MYMGIGPGLAPTISFEGHTIMVHVHDRTAHELVPVKLGGKPEKST